MAELTLRGIVKRYGNAKNATLKGIDLDIRDGEFLVLVGPSGCGKSTLLRTIAGLESITAGELKIGDRVVNDIHPKDRDIAMVFQSYALYPHMTIRRNMAFGLEVRKMPKNEIDRLVSEASAMLGLDDYLDKLPKMLSGGQRQRVAIARALLANPEIIIFDEATSALDYQSERIVMNNLKRIASGRTLLMVAHRLSSVRDCDCILVMEKGRMVEAGNHQQLMEKQGLYYSMFRQQEG